MIDAVEFGKQMGALIREAVAPLNAEIATLREQIKTLEARQPEKGEPGAAGRDAEPVAVSDVVAELVACKELKPVLALLVEESVGEHMTAHPVRDGRDGKDGERGAPGERGEKGMDGQNGRDGIGLAGALIDRDGSLVVTLANGEAKNLGLVVGKDGAVGRDGTDGLGFDDLEIGFDGESVTHTYRRGEQVKTFAFPMPVMKHIGFWREGMSAKAGNTTTHNGSLWIALRDTKATPCLENAEDWMLAARKGRDGDKGAPGSPPATPTVPLLGAGGG